MSLNTCRVGAISCITFYCVLSTHSLDEMCLSFCSSVPVPGCSIWSGKRIIRKWDPGEKKHYGWFQWCWKYSLDVFYIVDVYSIYCITKWIFYFVHLFWAKLVFCTCGTPYMKDFWLHMFVTYQRGVAGLEIEDKHPEEHFW